MGGGGEVWGEVGVRFEEGMWVQFDGREVEL